MIDTIIGHCPTVQNLPIGGLKIFGTNPYSEPMFRVIWSESRYYLVGASHTDYEGDPVNDKTLQLLNKDPNIQRRTVGYKWLPLYPGRGRWILEMWKSPFGFTGCTPEQYEIQYRDHNSGLLTLGPYPTRGEYTQCHQFNTKPTRGQVETLIGMIKAGWNYSYAEKKVAHEQANEKEQKTKENNFRDMFLDSQQAFKNKPVNVRPGKRTADKIQINKSAEQLRLRKNLGFNAGNPAQGV